MITAETVNCIVGFQANGLPLVSLYCRVDPGASQREVRARVDSLLDQIRPLARPMLAVLGEYSRACVLVINREAARSGRCTRTR